MRFKDKEKQRTRYKVEVHKAVADVANQEEVDTMFANTVRFIFDRL